jgi:hypothetical protein
MRIGSYAGRHITSVHPGWVRTNIAKSNKNGRLSLEESAQKIFQFITSDFKTGIYMVKIHPWLILLINNL